MALRRVLAAIVAVLLAGDVVALAVTAGGDDGGGGAVPREQAAAIRSVVTALQRFVESERGLTFKAPVEVELLAGDAFVRRLRGAAERDTEAGERAERFLRAVHLLEKDVELESAVDDLLATAVVGFYDPKSKELVVRGTEPSPYVRAVLVHELTHALQDQHFTLDRPALDDRTDEASQGFTGLVEGDAVRVQRAYLLSLSTEERRRFLAEEADLGDAPRDVPGVLIAVLLFPYQAGPAFVDAVLRAGGQPRLDAAFAAPPETSEHLLHPETYLEGQQPVAVTAPTPRGKAFDRGVFGELGILLLLREDLGLQTAARVAQGWGGDRYVGWRQGAQDCVGVRFVMDTPRDATELADALRRWADKRDGVTVSGTGPVVLTSCA